MKDLIINITHHGLKPNTCKRLTWEDLKDEIKAHGGYVYAQGESLVISFRDEEGLRQMFQGIMPRREGVVMFDGIDNRSRGAKNKNKNKATRGMYSRT